MGLRAARHRHATILWSTTKHACLIFFFPTASNLIQAYHPDPQGCLGKSLFRHSRAFVGGNPLRPISRCRFLLSILAADAQAHWRCAVRTSGIFVFHFMRLFAAIPLQPKKPNDLTCCCLLISLSWQPHMPAVGVKVWPMSLMPRHIPGPPCKLYAVSPSAPRLPPFVRRLLFGFSTLYLYRR
jgi:hypothetical protein